MIQAKSIKDLETSPHLTLSTEENDNEAISHYIKELKEIQLKKKSLIPTVPLRKSSQDNPHLKKYKKIERLSIAIIRVKDNLITPKCDFSPTKRPRIGTK